MIGCEFLMSCGHKDTVEVNGDTMSHKEIKLLGGIW